MSRVYSSNIQHTYIAPTEVSGGAHRRSTPVIADGRRIRKTNDTDDAQTTPSPAGISIGKFALSTSSDYVRTGDDSRVH